MDASFEDRVQWWRLLFCLRWLQKNMRVGLERARRGNLAGWTINDRPPNWRLRRYLARAWVWPEADFAAKLETAQGLTFFPGVG